MTHVPAADVVLDAGPRLLLFDLGLACCSVEFVAAATTPEALAAVGGTVTGLAGANVMVVSGTLTDVTSAGLREIYEQLAEPRYVVSFGACANTGGPYWDSYSVTKGVAQLLPVDVYVPGCPPRPETLLQALLLLQGGT